MQTGSTVTLEVGSHDPGLEGKSIEPTNGHIYCRSCARQHAHDDDVDPEHYELLDTKTGEAIPWSAIEIIE